MGKPKIKKIAKIAGDIIVYIFLLACVFGIIVSITSKKDSDGTANIFGYQMRFVLSPSMEACDETDVSDYDIKDIKTKSVVFIKTVPTDKAKALEWYSKLEVGDVLTFKYVYTTQETITHRITKIDPKRDEGGSVIGYIIELKGDNKAEGSEVLTQVIDTSYDESFNYVIGKVTATSYPIGLFVSALKSPIGIAMIVIIPCFVVIVLEVIKITGLLGAEKKKKALESQRVQDEMLKKQEDELAELKRRLAELEKKPNDDN